MWKEGERNDWLRECIRKMGGGNRTRGRPQRRWRNEEKDLLLGRRLSEREGMMLARDRDSWARMVYKVE